MKYIYRSIQRLHDLCQRTLIPPPKKKVFSIEFSFKLSLTFNGTCPDGKHFYYNV